MREFQLFFWGVPLAAGAGSRITFTPMEKGYELRMPVAFDRMIETIGAGVSTISRSNGVPDWNGIHLHAGRVGTQGSVVAVSNPTHRIARQGRLSRIFTL